MKDIQLDVNGQQLTKHDIHEPLQIGSTKYIRFRISSIDPDWCLQRIIAVFTYKDLEVACPVVNNTVILPDEFSECRVFKMYIAMVNGDTTIKTNKIIFEQR